MNKKRFLMALLVAVIAATSVFAGWTTTEADKLWFKANKLADSSEYYIAGTRNMALQFLDKNGNEMMNQTAVALLYPVNKTKIEEMRFGETEVFDLADRFTDGGVLTPFCDAVIDYDYKSLGDETIEGQLCTVFSVDYCFAKGVLWYTEDSSEGAILGADEDGDLNGKISAKMWINKSTGAIVKIENTFDFGNETDDFSYQKIVQTALYSTTDSISTPSTIFTEGSIKLYKRGGIANTQYFTLKEVQKEFWYNSSYER